MLFFLLLFHYFHPFYLDMRRFCENVAIQLEIRLYNRAVELLIFRWEFFIFVPFSFTISFKNFPQFSLNLSMTRTHSNVVGYKTEQIGTLIVMAEQEKPDVDLMWNKSFAIVDRSISDAMITFHRNFLEIFFFFFRNKNFRKNNFKTRYDE